MRLVVGPLPASVYWRRRAIVLGAAALAVLLVAYSCSQSKKTPAAVTSSTKPSASASAKPQPVVAPAVEQSTTPPSSPPAQAAAGPGDCTDEEILVTPVPEKTTMPRGTEIQINLLIKNKSNRECSRDVGADMQELYIKLGTEPVWSSDNCGGPTSGHSVLKFAPNLERSYRIHWNGHSSSVCNTANTAAAGPIPEAGEYQLLGRVGSDISQPVTLKLT